MDKETKELQIRLAKFQADVRVYTAGMFASVSAVVTLSLIAFGYNLDFWETGITSIPKIVMSLVLIGFTSFFVYAAFRFRNALIKSRNELDNLK